MKKQGYNNTKANVVWLVIYTVQQTLTFFKVYIVISSNCTLIKLLRQQTCM